MALLEEMESQGNWLFKYRGVLPIIILLVGAYLHLQTVLHPEIWVLAETPYEVIYETGCLLISLLGLSIRIYTVGYTPANTSGRNTGSQIADTLNTAGIYSIVRHPLYLGNFFMWTGVALLTANFWFIIAFIVLYWLYYERIMFAEEQFLRKKMGEPYLNWAAKTPAFIPRFSQFVKSSYSFSWKKVLRQEKNGLVATFLIFSLFDVAGEIVKKKSDYNYFFLAGFIASLIAYLVLKYLKYRTNILDEKGR